MYNICMQAIDQNVLQFFVNHRIEWLSFVALTITYAGGYMIAGGVAVLSAISFYIHNHTRRILPLFIAIVGSSATTYILKHLIERARPIYQLYFEDGFSFPSGHATTAMALYGFLILVIWQHTESNKKTKYLSIFFLSLLVILIGVSRLYLGVHHLSDILVGYLVGFIWLSISLAILKPKS